MDRDDTDFTVPAALEADPMAFLEQALGESDPVPDGNTPEADPFEIPTLKLPSGATVEFRSLATVTREKVDWLRKSMDAAGAGSFLGEMTSRGAQMLILAWDATTPDGRPLQVPSKTAGKSFTALSYTDAQAIENHLRKPLTNLMGTKAGK